MSWFWPQSSPVAFNTPYPQSSQWSPSFQHCLLQSVSWVFLQQTHRRPVLPAGARVVPKAILCLCGVLQTSWRSTSPAQPEPLWCSESTQHRVLCISVPSPATNWAWNSSRGPADQTQFQWTVRAPSWKGPLGLQSRVRCHLYKLCHQQCRGTCSLWWKQRVGSTRRSTLLKSFQTCWFHCKCLKVAGYMDKSHCVTFWQTELVWMEWSLVISPALPLCCSEPWAPSPQSYDKELPPCSGAQYSNTKNSYEVIFLS